MIRKIKDSLSIDNETKFLLRAVDVYTAIFMDTHLTKREKQFFIELIYLNRDGVDLLGKHANAHLKEKMNFNSKQDRGVWIYREKLKKKGWILQTPTSMKLIPTFDLSKNNIDNFLFNINIRHDINRRDNTERD